MTSHEQQQQQQQQQQQMYLAHHQNRQHQHPDPHQDQQQQQAIHWQHQQPMMASACASQGGNYYEPAASQPDQQCHQADYYNGIHHTPVDPFPHHSQAQPPLAPAATAGAVASPATTAATAAVAANANCWTSPQVATSPVVIQQFHSINLNSLAQQSSPAPASPYTNHTGAATYTNGYHHPQHQHYLSHQHHHPHHQQHQQQQQHQHHQQQQQHHQHSAQHHQHTALHHHHHQAILQSPLSMSEDAYLPHHQQHQHQTQSQHEPSVAYSSHYPQTSIILSPDVHSPRSGGSISVARTVVVKQQTTSLPMHMPPNQPIHAQQPAQMRNHYHSPASANKVPISTSDTNLAFSARASSIVGANSPPKSHPTQNLLSSPVSVSSGIQMCATRTQLSSVASSTASAGSNLSDHQSPAGSPSNSSTIDGQTSLPSSSLLDSATTGPRHSVIESRLSAGCATDIEQDNSKESQLSQLHQQCAVLLLDEQQQYVAINSPNSNLNNNNNNNGTTASIGTNNNNNINSNTSSSGNNSGRSKRLRTSFKHNQLKEMKRWFAKNQNPDANHLKTLAQSTGLSKRVLQVWFQNARAKFRRNNAKAANQQLYDVNHTSHMLQFQQQQQNYHHQYHARPITDPSLNSQQSGH